ncbi:MAG: MBOAT family protein [Clostridiales bacterium]|nr:MBOAT family protein [Clostridiales bacterium]
MLFTSLPFVLFVAILVLTYYAFVPHNERWGLLLIASLGFYFFADPRYLIFIFVTALTAFIIADITEDYNAKRKAYLKANKADMDADVKKKYKATTTRVTRLLLALSLIINLGILAYTKYINFFIENINAVRGGEPLSFVNVIIPMGISFYTFQTVSYSIDVARGTCKAQKNFWKFLLFVSFFPQLVQGPISRYEDLSKTLYDPKPFDFRNVSYGFIRILFGYFKKLVIADRLVIGLKTLTESPDEYKGAFVFVVMMFYAAQLYCDFTGGIDITIGIAQMLGITVKENFDLPYFSKNIKEYWNRWHITMGTWFTDYIFFPLSVSSRMLKLSKWSRNHLGNAIGKRVTVYISCFCVWLATGIWHGAAWHFVVWGLMNFVVIMASQELEPLYERFHGRFGLKTKGWYGAFEILRTFLLMSSLKLFDCYRDVGVTFRMFGSMFTTFNAGKLFGGELMNLGLSGGDYLVAGLAIVIVFLISLVKFLKGTDVREWLYDRYPLFVLSCVCLLLAVAVFGAYGAGFDASQFIYNQF